MDFENPSTLSEMGWGNPLVDLSTKVSFCSLSRNRSQASKPKSSVTASTILFIRALRSLMARIDVVSSSVLSSFSSRTSLCSHLSSIYLF